MRIDQKTTFVFTSLGILSGIFSNYMQELSFAVSIPLIAYLLTTLIIAKAVKVKGKKMIILNSFVTFALVWLLVWIFIFNYLR